MPGATTGYAGLCKIEFPTGPVLLCEGGRVDWGSEIYRERHGTFGSILSIDNLSEGVGDEVPAMVLVLGPPASAPRASLSQPGFQTSRVRFWLAEVDLAAMAVTGTPDLQFSGWVDQTDLNLRGELKVTVVSEAERLFERNRGSALSPVFHKALFPGETGHDNATGLSRPVAWGIEAPPGTLGSGSAALGGGSSWLARGRWQAA